MTTTDSAAGSIDEDIAAAVQALTAAACRTYVSGQGSLERYDFAEIACRVITAVAANVGSVGALTAGRPGSWEAGYIDQIVTSTVPEDELLTYRTEPVRITIHPEEVFSDLGIRRLYDEDLDDIAAELEGDLTDEQWTALKAEEEAVEQLYARDLEIYVSAYTDVVCERCRDVGITVPVQVTRIDNHTPGTRWFDQTTTTKLGLVDDFDEYARLNTPLPGSGLIQGNEFLDGDAYCAAERAAGRSPRDRARRSPR